VERCLLLYDRETRMPEAWHMLICGCGTSVIELLSCTRNAVAQISAQLLYDQLDEVRHEPLGVDVHFEKAVASARHLYEYIPVRLRCQMRPCQSDLAANSQRMAETDD
jgi:hypothetical protein